MHWVVPPCSLQAHCTQSQGKSFAYAQKTPGRARLPTPGVAPRVGSTRVEFDEEISEGWNIWVVEDVGLSTWGRVGFQGLDFCSKLSLVLL